MTTATAPTYRAVDPAAYSLRIAATYALAAMLWILLSNAVLDGAAIDEARLARIETIKDLGFVVVTTLLLYLLLRRHISAVSRLRVDLDRSARQYEKLFDGNPLPMWVYDPATYAFLAVNEAAVRTYGYSRAEFLAMSIKDIRPADDLSSLERFLAGLGNLPGASRSGLWRHRRKDGAVIDVEIASHQVDFEGHSAWLVLAENVTETRRARAALAESEERLRLVLSATNLGMWDFELESGGVVVNPEYAQMLGYDPAEFVEDWAAWLARLHPDEREPTLATLRGYLAGEAAEYRAEFRQRTREGHWKWIRSIGKVVERDVMGRPVRMLGTHTDIDREKQAQARIDRLTGLYSALSQTGQAMVRAADPQGLYRDVCRIAVEQGRLSMAWVGTVDAAHDEVVPVASFGDGTGYAEHARIVLDAAQPEGRGPAALSIRNGQHYVCNDFDADPATMPWRERARAAGFHAVASFPLWREGSAIAVLNLYSDQLGYFDEDIVELLDRMVSDLGLALDRFALNERRAAAEQRLRHSESRLTEAQRIARIGSWEYVFATDRMGFSEQTFDLFGIDPTPDASLPRAQFQQLIHPADRELVQREFERAVTQRSTFETVHRIALHDGSASHVHVRGEIEYDDAGAPHSARGTVQDVSQHVLAEAALRESESRFRHLLASLDDVVWAAAIEDGRMLYISEAAERVYGWPMDAFFGDPQIWLRAVLPADQEHVHEAFDALAASGHAECEYRIVRGDGEVRWLHERRSVIRDEAGAPGRIAGIASDITARKQAEERLRASEESFRALASVSPVGIFRTDARGACLYVNRKWCEIAGMEEDQAHGHGWERALHPDDRLPVTIEWYAAAARGGFYLDECRFQRPGGGVTWVISQATPEHDENGDVIGYVGCLTDINERKAAEEALRASSLRIEALSRRMLQLQEEERRALARELHDEVGQQLGALRLNLDALRRGLSDGVAQGRLTDCAEIVDTTIAQIRDRALDLRPAVLDDLGLKPALDSYGKRQAMRSGCAIEVKASPLPSNATGEQQSALFRIAQESVNNALRHSQASRIEIAVRFEEGASVLSVRDDGIGFDVGATLAREYTGTGLGLPGMRERAELLGGTFEIRSEPGAGTEVVARIPVEPQA